MTVLVLGGAGYIGSHAVDMLVARGYKVAVIDNLSTGHQKSIHPEATFFEGDIRDKDFLREVFTKLENIEGILHFAAFSLVAESMQKPLKYFDNNVYGCLTLLETMKEFHVNHIIFSSTAATFGIPQEVPITETTPTNPINPYGQSKLMMEEMMKWQSAASELKYVALRYFNVAGAKEDGSIGEAHTCETHLIPIILEVASGKRTTLTIYGDDYQTKDGTNIRDYIHVGDLIDAHILALEYLQKGGQSNVFNLGSAEGFSNKEMLEAARRVTNHPIPAEIGPRRPGDPDVLVASSEKAQRILGWQPKYTSIEDIIATAWNWHQKHPNGYND